MTPTNEQSHIISRVPEVELNLLSHKELVELCLKLDSMLKAERTYSKEVEQNFEISRKASHMFENASNLWMERALKAEAKNATN